MEQVAAQWQERFALVIGRLGAEIEPLQSRPPRRAISTALQPLSKLAQAAGLLDQLIPHCTDALITR